MFNSEQKERFIKEFAYTDSVRKSCVTTFEKASQIESELGRDFCTMTIDEAQNVVDLVGAVRGNNARVNILYAYIRWCLWNHIPGAKDDALQTNKQSYDKIKHRMVSGPFHLQMCLDQIFEPENILSVDNLYRCFCWFAFMDIPPNETIKITSDEVDFSDMVIRHNLQSYPIYRESIPAIKNCATLTEFFIPHYETDQRVRPRFPGNELMRGLSSVKSLNSIRISLASKRKEKVDLGIDVQEFSYGTLRLSGAFYRIYEKERAGIEPDMSSIADATMDGKSYNLGRQRLTLKGKRNQLTNAYLEDYYAWKQVFC